LMLNNVTFHYASNSILQQIPTIFYGLNMKK
jgi:hypothetical protein